TTTTSSPGRSKRPPRSSMPDQRRAPVPHRQDHRNALVRSERVSRTNQTHERTRQHLVVGTAPGGVSTRKIGWSGAIRRSSSLGESVSTPPKNWPTSHVQRLR